MLKWLLQVQVQFSKLLKGLFLLQFWPFWPRLSIVDRCRFFHRGPGRPLTRYGPGPPSSSIKVPYSKSGGYPRRGSSKKLRSIARHKPTFPRIGPHVPACSRMFSHILAYSRIGRHAPHILGSPSAGSLIRHAGWKSFGIMAFCPSSKTTLGAVEGRRFESYAEHVLFGGRAPEKNPTLI